MKQWRILHSEASLGWGGQEIRVLTELEWMRQQGYWVSLLAPKNSEIAKRADAKGIPVVYMSTSKPLVPLSILGLAIWILRNRVTVVSPHSSLDGWIAGIAAKITFIPLIIRYRHIEVDYPNLFWARLAFGYLPDFVVTTSQRIADRLEKEVHVAKKRLFCIPTGVDLNLFRPDKPDLLHEELNLSKETLIVGMISVLRSWKGHQVLLDAWRIFLESRPADAPPVHLVIAGTGPGRDELASKKEAHPFGKQISLLGHRSDVPAVLASLSVLVLPSIAHEGIPQIILQAQAMERAIVASSIGGIPEVIEDGETGLLVPPNDPNALAEKLRILIQKPELRAKLGDAARACILKNHSLDAMGLRLLNLYDLYYRK